MSSGIKLECLGKMGHHQILLMVFVLVLLVGVLRSDFAADREECADSLVGLAPCLDYVTAAAKAPTLDCCRGLQQILGKTPKCLCVLIKDRDNPDLGFKINATRAITMPTTCKTVGANATRCIDLLHLSPSSPDAKIFEQPGAPSGSARASPAAKPNATSSGSSGASASAGGGRSANEKSTGRMEGWAFREMGMGIGHCLLGVQSLIIDLSVYSSFSSVSYKNNFQIQDSSLCEFMFFM